MSRNIVNVTALLLAAGLCLAQQHKSDSRQKLVPFEQDGKWGYRDTHGKVAVAPRFTVAQAFGQGGIAPVVDDDGWAYIDLTGKIVIRPFVVDNGPDYFREGLSRFRSNGKFGFFNQSGTVVVQPRFDFVLPFSDGLAAFCTGCAEHQEGEHHSFRGGTWGYIGTSGEVLIPPGFEAAEDFTNGRARVRSNGKWITIDRKGK